MIILKATTGMVNVTLEYQERPWENGPAQRKVPEQHATTIMSTAHAQNAVLSTKSLRATAFRSVESRL